MSKQKNDPEIIDEEGQREIEEKEIEEIRQIIYGTDLTEQTGQLEVPEVSVPVILPSPVPSIPEEDEQKSFEYPVYVPPGITDTTHLFRDQIAVLNKAVNQINEMLPVACLSCNRRFNGVTAEIVKMMANGIGDENTNPIAKAHVAIGLLLSNTYQSLDEEGNRTLMTPSNWNSRVFDLMTSDTPNDPQVVLHTMGLKLRSVTDVPSKDDLVSNNAFILYIVGEKIFDRYLIDGVDDAKALSLIGVSKSDIESVQIIKQQWMKGQKEIESELKEMKIKLAKKLGLPPKLSATTVDMIERWSEFKNVDDRRVHIAKKIIPLRSTQWIYAASSRASLQFDKNTYGSDVDGFVEYAKTILLFDEEQSDGLKKLISVDTLEEFVSELIFIAVKKRSSRKDVKKFIRRVKNMRIKKGKGNTYEKYSDRIISDILGISHDDLRDFQVWSTYRSLDPSDFNLEGDENNGALALYRRLGGSSVEFETLMNIIAINSKDGHRWERLSRTGLDESELVSQIMGVPVVTYTPMTALEKLRENRTNEAFISFIEDTEENTEDEEDTEEEEKEDTEEEDTEEDPKHPAEMTDRQHLQSLGVSEEGISFVLEGSDILTLVSTDVKEYIKNRRENSISKSLAKILGDRTAATIRQRMKRISKGDAILRSLLSKTFYDEASARMTDEFIFKVKTNIGALYSASVEGQKDFLTAYHLLANDPKSVRMFSAMIKTGGVGMERTMNILGYEAICCRTVLVAPPIISKGTYYHQHQKTPGSSMYRLAVEKNTSEERTKQRKLPTFINAGTLERMPEDKMLVHPRDDIQTEWSGRSIGQSQSERFEEFARGIDIEEITGRPEFEDEDDEEEGTGGTEINVVPSSSIQPFVMTGGIATAPITAPTGKLLPIPELTIGPESPMTQGSPEMLDLDSQDEIGRQIMLELTGNFDEEGEFVEYEDEHGFEDEHGYEDDEDEGEFAGDDEDFRGQFVF